MHVLCGYAGTDVVKVCHWRLAGTFNLSTVSHNAFSHGLKYGGYSLEIEVTIIDYARA